MEIGTKVVILSIVILAGMVVPTSAFATYNGQEEFSEDTTLIDNCTMPDPKTQCFTEALDNGTLLVTNGKPEPVVPTTTGERIDFSNVPITEIPYGETYEEQAEEDFTDEPVVDETEEYD